MEDIEKNLEALEEEKKEYLEEHPDEEQEGGDEEEMEDKEIDVMEISLEEDEINELIGKLERLRDEKEHVHFDLDDDNALKINYEESEEGDEE